MNFGTIDIGNRALLWVNEEFIFTQQPKVKIDLDQVKDRIVPAEVSRIKLRIEPVGLSR